MLDSAPIIDTTGLARKPRAGSPIAFAAPVRFDGAWRLVVDVDGVAVCWATIPDYALACRLLDHAQRRYLEDGETLDARRLLEELGACG